MNKSKTTKAQLIQQIAELENQVTELKQCKPCVLIINRQYVYDFPNIEEARTWFKTKLKSYRQVTTVENKYSTVVSVTGAKSRK